MQRAFEQKVLITYRNFSFNSRVNYRPQHGVSFLVCFKLIRCFLFYTNFYSFLIIFLQLKITFYQVFQQCLPKYHGVGLLD